MSDSPPSIKDLEDSVVRSQSRLQQAQAEQTEIEQASLYHVNTAKAKVARETYQSTMAWMKLNQKTSESEVCRTASRVGGLRSLSDGE